MALVRSKVKVYYKNAVALKELKVNGYVTGEYETVYSDIKSTWLYVTPNKGNGEVHFFGNSLDYDRVMIGSNTTLDINEFSILWIDTEEIDKPHNYIVKSVSKSSNVVQYAIKKVVLTNELPVIEGEDGQSS